MTDYLKALCERLAAERDQAEKLWRAGSQILRDNTTALESVSAERDRFRALAVTLTGALEELQATFAWHPLGEGSTPLSRARAALAAAREQGVIP